MKFSNSKHELIDEKDNKVNRSYQAFEKLNNQDYKEAR